ncbi:hypothetical protein GDO81_006879 [Engystomops pustulosus]|uniref:Beta/gamma crystallin 'Greek key' domain-containing protein n=2 Tax=Engystomops pustulosus TaxID=76066 RepID=A0AAV7D0Q0_ENGPU|nr:hypothetical protein GDO81_006879 [Engystomops pustulosus]
MSTRRRAGTWQDEVARSFSRLFNRTSSQEKEEESAKEPAEEQDRGDRGLSRLFFRSPSQEKKDGSDRAEHGEEQERSHSPSRLFFRRVTQESKGGNDNVSPAKGNKEEQDRNRVFSRLFSRTSSQEKEEENDSSRGAKEDQNRHEDNHINPTSDSHEERSSPEPDQVTQEQTLGPPLHNISEPEEEKNEEFHHSKILDSEKQSRENFFHFIGNLFHFSPKSSMGNMKQDAGVQEPCKEHEDSRVKNNLDKEDLNQEQTLDDHSGTEEAPQESRESHEQERPGVNEGENPNDGLEHCKDEVMETPKLNGYSMDAPAITYGTYRGSRKIRKLIKRRASVNSPIPEREELSDTTSVGDVNVENGLMEHEWVKMEPTPDRNCQDEIPPSEIHINMESKPETLDQSLELYNDVNIIQNENHSKPSNEIKVEDKDTPISSNGGKANTVNNSETVEDKQLDTEEYIKAIQELSVKESSETLQPETGERQKDLQPSPGESLDVSGNLKQNTENSENHSKESTILETLCKGHYTEAEPMDISETITHTQQNTDEIYKKSEDLQPSIQENIYSPEHLQTIIDKDSESETVPSPKATENLNILLNALESIENNSEMGNLESEVMDRLVKTEELEESSEGNTTLPDDLSNSVSYLVDLQSALQQSQHEMVLDLGDCSNEQEILEDKPHKDPSENLFQTEHNRSEKIIKDINLVTIPEIEKRETVTDLHPNVQWVPSSSGDVGPNTMDIGVKHKQELDSTCPESKEIPNLHVDLNETPRTLDELPQMENIEHLQTNTEFIPEKDLQNDKKLLQTELKSNTEEQNLIRLKQMDNSTMSEEPQQIDRLQTNTMISPDNFLQNNKKLLIANTKVSGNIPKETSITSEDLQRIEIINHLQPNSKIISENDLQNAKKLLRTEQLPNSKVSQETSEDIPNLDLQPDENSVKSEDMQQTENIEPLPINATIIPADDEKLFSTELQANSKVSEKRSEDISNLDLQPGENSVKSEDMQPTENIEPLSITAKIIPGNDEKLFSAELQTNSKVSEKTSESIPNLDLLPNETRLTSEDLQQIENKENLQSNTKSILENDVQNDEKLLKTEPPVNTKVSEERIENISSLDQQLSEMSRTSDDLQLIGNIDQANTSVIPENDPPKDGELLIPNTKVTFQLKECSDESPLKSGIISKMIEDQKPNIHILSNVSDGIQAKAGEPSKVNSNSEIHLPDVSNDSTVHKVSENQEFGINEGLTENSLSNSRANEDNVYVDKPNGQGKTLNIKPSVSNDNHDNFAVPESCLKDITSCNEDNKGWKSSRNISFDNGIECRSPSPVTISDSSSYVDCNDIQFDSPNDSGIVSSQAYTPEEHVLFKTFPSEIIIKNASDPFSVDQKNEETSAPKLDSIVNVQNVSVLQNKEPTININNVSPTSNFPSDLSRQILSPDKLVSVNSDVYVAKVSVKTVNIEEVKISPYGLCSDVISFVKLESPTYAKEVIRIPNMSPPPTDTENTFQVVHFVEDSKDFVPNTEMPKDREGHLIVNNWEKLTNCNSDKSPSHEDSDRDNIPQYTIDGKELPKVADKSPDVFIENLKNNNINVCTGDNIINASLREHESGREFADEGLTSSDTLKELRLGESLSELNPDSKMNHREKLSDLLLHSALLHDVTDTNEIISSCSTNVKMILPGKDHSESSNELFEQKANEIIFSVLHSAIDELQNINQSHINIHTLTDIKHVKENLSENHIDLKEHPAEVLDRCLVKPSDHIPIKDADLIMSMAVGIVNDVISTSSQIVVSNIILNDLNKDISSNENPMSILNHNDQVEDATNSNHVGSSLGIDNLVHLPSGEINSNVLQVTSEVPLKVESRQDVELGDLSSGVNEDMYKNDEKKMIESNVLGNTEDEERLRFSESPVITKTFNFNENYSNGDLMFDDLYCDRRMESISCGSEGSMEDVVYNNMPEERSNSLDFSDFLQFTVYKSQYIELSGSDDESTDEEKSDGSEQASTSDSFLPVQSRRVRIYPYALSPIYEDDSACEDTSSSRGSPGYNEGTAARNNGHDHTSILSLLQSVSDRLKEADLEEASSEERSSSLSKGVSAVSDRFSKEGSGVQEDLTIPSKKGSDVPSILEDEKNFLGTRSGLFITKSFGENKPNLVSGRQSLLLNLTSQSKIYGAKPSVESNSAPPLRSETSASSSAESTPYQSIDLSSSTPDGDSLSSEPSLAIQSPTVDHKPKVSPSSVYYQYFNDAQNYLSNIEDSGSPAQNKIEERNTTAEPETDPTDSDSLKFNPRPGKVILSDIVDQENKIELKADILDATSWKFPNGVNIRVIRGCWILYEKPHFEGQAHVLEEGEAVLRHLWDLQGSNTNPDKITIGSVKRVAKDYLPEVVISSLQDVSDSPIYIRTEVPSLENLVGRHPRALVVNSGVWLAYTEAQYNGTVTVLEEGCELPQIQDSGLKSMRPLKMGGLKVQLPSDPKIIIYEKSHFQGWSREITEHVSSIGPLTCDGDDSNSHHIGSLQVIGGIWVGYEKERYKGQQYLMEEGDYEDWHAWGGYNETLQSIRYLQADFLESSVTLYEADQEDGKQINLYNQAIPDLELAGHNTRTQCIDVKKGMWVAYRQKHFCGEQYILEKGRYKTYVDWGGSNNTIMSIRPVLLEPLGRNDVKHSIKLYSGPEFQGEAVDLTQAVSDFTSFMPMSFKVLRGCWLLGYETDSCDNLCVLEEGHFPDLASCGCPTAVIKYIKPIDYVFAEPSISLFALDSCEGRELHFEEAVTSVLSKDLHFFTQSVWVRRGLWIAFEGANFLGRQMLLDPQQILNWSQFSGWKAIGSLRPVKQPPVYFMVKNRDKDKYLTVTGKDLRATFISVSPRNGQTTQIWYFCRGFLKSKASDTCLDVIGGKNIPGSKVSLWAEHGKTRQKWKINKDGTISSYISDDLVLDLKGGNYYDQNYIVVNKLQENVLTQKWDVEIL